MSFNAASLTGRAERTGSYGDEQLDDGEAGASPEEPTLEAGGIPDASDGALARRDAFYRRALAAADVLAVLVALGSALALGGDRPSPLVLLVVPLALLASTVMGGYGREELRLRKTTLEEGPAVFRVATVHALLISLGDQPVLGEDMLDAHVLALWGILVVAMLVCRAGARLLVGRLTPVERCVVVGDAASARRIERKLALARGPVGALVGRVPFEQRRRDDLPAQNPADEGDEGVKVLGTLDLLGPTLSEHDVDRVLIAPRNADSQDILDVIRLVKSVGVKVSLVPRLFEVVGSSVEFDHLDGVTLLGVPRYDLSASSRRLKRGLDVVGTCVGAVVLAPLVLAIAVGIKLSSPGPVVFVQRRVGRGGKEFDLLKFRTMVQGADELKPALLELNEADGIFKIADDPRITRFGRWLRQTSLDELPQLVNVLRGEMSLVGPRPLIPEEDRRVHGWNRRRLGLTPGMTGPWQIAGSARVPLDEMVKIDYLYLANWSPWVDVMLLLRTIPVVVGRRGL
jgi:exopolysaccharide biosynthesis polyprenyl glycosylphosphotransferase